VLSFMALSLVVNLPPRIESAILLEWAEFPSSPIPLLERREVEVPDRYRLQSCRFPWKVLKSTDKLNQMTYVVFPGRDAENSPDQGPWDFVDWIKPGLRLTRIHNCTDPSIYIDVLADIWEILLEELRPLCEFLNSMEIGRLTICGHAKGGMAAKILGLLITTDIQGPQNPLYRYYLLDIVMFKLITFGAPNVVFAGVDTAVNLEDSVNGCSLARKEWLQSNFSGGIMQAYTIEEDPLPLLFSNRHAELAQHYRDIGGWFSTSEGTKMINTLYGDNLEGASVMGGFKDFLNELTLPSNWDSIPEDEGKPFVLSHNDMARYTDAIIHHVLVVLHKQTGVMKTGLGASGVGAARPGLIMHLMLLWRRASAHSVQVRLDGLEAVEMEDEELADHIDEFIEEHA